MLAHTHTHTHPHTHTHTHTKPHALASSRDRASIAATRKRARIRSIQVDCRTHSGAQTAARTHWNDSGISRRTRAHARTPAARSRGAGAARQPLRLGNLSLQIQCGQIHGDLQSARVQVRLGFGWKQVLVHDRPGRVFKMPADPASESPRLRPRFWTVTRSWSLE